MVKLVLQTIGCSNRRMPGAACKWTGGGVGAEKELCKDGNHVDADGSVAPLYGCGRCFTATLQHMKKEEMTKEKASNSDITIRKSSSENLEKKSTRP